MKKILILPYHVNKTFENSEYLPEGILEELIYIMASVPEISTTSRSTSLYLKNNPIPHGEINSRFDVDYVLEGSVIYEKEHLFLRSQLYDASTESLMFSLKHEFQLERWTLPLDDLVREITKAILGNETACEELSKDTSKAREYYQQGLYHWNRYTHKEMLLGITFFKKAIRENPSFALSYAAIADCFGIIGAMGYDKPKPAFTQAKEAVKKALKLNDKRSEPYVSAAFINIFYNHNFEKAKANLEQALRLNKNSVKAHHFFAMYYIHVADLQNAEKHSLLTIKLDALALPHYAMITRICIYQRRFKSALDYVNIGLGIDVEATPLVELRGTINLLSGNTESAIEDFIRCIKNDSENPKYKANLAYAYSKIGFYQESRTIEAQVNALSINKETGFFDFAMAIIKLGQADIKSFLIHIEKSANHAIGILPGELINNPIFSEVKKNSRIQDLLIKLNHLESKSSYNKIKRPSSAVTLISHTNETIVLDPQDISFIEANDNYCTVHWLDSGILTKKMLRITLKSIEEQLRYYKYIIRCHKSYMINLNEDMHIMGNAREAFFESSYLPIRIPISRSRKEFVERSFKAQMRLI